MISLALNAEGTGAMRQSSLVFHRSCLAAPISAIVGACWYFVVRYRTYPALIITQEDVWQLPQREAP
jgi:hypothetical protein